MSSRIVRTLTGKRFVVLGAAVLAGLSIIMLFQTTRVTRENSFLQDDAQSFPSTVYPGNGYSEADASHSRAANDINSNSGKINSPSLIRGWYWQRKVQSSPLNATVGKTRDPTGISSDGISLTNNSHSGQSPLKIWYAPPLSSAHPCHSFTFPPPPRGRRRKSGFRPCPVCYLPRKLAKAAEPPPGREEGLILKQLNYSTSDHPSERSAAAQGKPPKFGGYPTWEDRAESFRIREAMTVHCGFVWGEKPGVGTGYDISHKDRKAMEACKGIVVASAIFGAYDLLQQPANISRHSLKRVCFFMFVDEESWEDLESSGQVQAGPAGSVPEKVGVWRLVLVKNLPFEDPRRTGKIPKLLVHRLFPRARFSIWMDAKLKLMVDPYQVMERFLWRGNFSWAISKHYKRFDVFVEAEANKAAGKYSNASIDQQIEVYRRDGLTPYTAAKLPIISDVPEGCLIIREHTPITNLFACLWFNEVDRFTSRDQLSFGYTRDKVLAQVPWRFSMFEDCERRNFVVQGYHKDVLREKLAGMGAPVDVLMKKVALSKDGHLTFPKAQ